MSQIAKILQLTDLHLFENANSKLIGINPLQTLQKVIDKIANNLEENSPDLIVLSGDIAQDYSLNSYKIAAQLLEQFDCPVVATLGNHDLLPFFSKAFGKPHQLLKQVATLTNWRIIILNSHWDQHVGGYLAEDELAFLEKSLDESRNHPTMIFIHHHILPVQSRWLDQINLKNSTDFLNIIDQYNNIKAVICGHVHQDTSTTRNNIPFLSTPSTGWQFTVNSDNFKLDTLMPGYRWITLHEDGTFQTEVVRIEHNDDFLPDQSVKGY